MNAERSRQQNEHGKKIIRAGGEILAFGVAGFFYPVLFLGMIHGAYIMAKENYELYKESTTPLTKGGMPEKISQGSKLIL